jgi:hypothetical protein
VATTKPELTLVRQVYLAGPDPHIEAYLAWLRPQCRSHETQWHLVAATSFYSWHRENGSRFWRRCCWSQIQKAVAHLGGQT